MTNIVEEETRSDPARDGNADAALAVPALAALVALVARHWPWWQGRSRLSKLFDRALGRQEGFAIGRLSESNLRLKVPLSDSVGRKLLAFAENDRELFQFLCLELENPDQDAVYLDVGVNLGVFLLRVAERFPIRCVGFEPQAHLCSLLRENIARNELRGTVDCRHSAVGSSVGTVSFDIDKTDSGISRVSDQAGGVTVPITTLAHEFDASTWSRVKVVKVDVEGFELEVFNGARELFAKHRPTLVFEVNTDEMTQRGLTPRSIGDALRAMGYTEFWALEKHLYPIENGMFKVANVVAEGSGGSAAVRKLGIRRDYYPTPQKYWPVNRYEF